MNTIWHTYYLFSWNWIDWSNISLSKASFTKNVVVCGKCFMVRLSHFYVAVHWTMFNLHFMFKTSTPLFRSITFSLWTWPSLICFSAPLSVHWLWLSYSIKDGLAQKPLGCAVCQAWVQLALLLFPLWPSLELP